jgi:hypothetical protein
VQILFVTGCLLSLIVAEIHIQPLNHSVAFFKERDTVLSSDTWRVAVGLDINTYEEATSAIRADVLMIEEHRKEFTSVSEFKQIDTLLNTLELKLHYFQQILPRRDRRRGSTLKTFLGRQRFLTSICCKYPCLTTVK